MPTFGSRAPYADPRNEREMRNALKNSGRFPTEGPTSTAWLNSKLSLAQRGEEWNVARAWRIAQEDLVTARLDEEKQIQDLMTNRRPSLIGEGARVRNAQRVAEQAYQMQE